ncbi:MAG: 16S rRNA (cytosine(1402)-N(4))-methyltransferase RsmH [Salibacteraceae bacterium]
MSKYHTPVMLSECLKGLDISEGGTYVDVTFGGGGHSREIIKLMGNGKLFGFDQDPDAFENEIEDDRFTLIKQNFKYLKNFLKLNRALPVSGILADLGVSSHQFDTAERGFSTRFDGPLDMRMSPTNQLSATKVINEYSEEKLTEMFYQYGEVKNARKLSLAIAQKRFDKKITTTAELKEICESLVSSHRIAQYLAQVFQAIRIEVNQELEVLKTFLEESLDCLDQGGRLVVMSYHSLEDRLVKNFIKTGNFQGKLEKDFYGNIIRPYTPIPNKVIVASDQEKLSNPRSRSARLRIAVKN